MPKFVMEKLPPQWVFVPSKRQVKALLAETGADVQRVECYGTSSGRLPARLALGFVESRVVGSGWCFYVRLWGVREAAVESCKNELAQAALAVMERYLRGRISQPPTEVIKPSQLSLSFRLSPEGVVSTCRVKAADRRAFPVPAYWMDE
jgi:hypothetical protein